jgi:hypothetical protein
MTFSDETLRALPLEDLRALVRLGEKQLYDRQCQSSLDRIGHCTAEPPHSDGWHEHRPAYASVAHPAHTAAPHPAVIRWRFEDDVVALEHEHEARRRPGAN